MRRRCANEGEWHNRNLIPVRRAASKLTDTEVEYLVWSQLDVVGYPGPPPTQCTLESHTHRPKRRTRAGTKHTWPGKLACAERWAGDD